MLSAEDIQSSYGTGRILDSSSITNIHIHLRISDKIYDNENIVCLKFYDNRICFLSVILVL